MKMWTRGSLARRTASHAASMSLQHGTHCEPAIVRLLESIFELLHDRSQLTKRKAGKMEQSCRKGLNKRLHNLPPSLNALTMPG